MDLLNETVLLKTKSTLFNLLIWETSHFLCNERLLNMTNVTYKNAFFSEMQFWSHRYTVVSYQALFRLSVYKIPAVYLSGAKKMCVFAWYATLVPQLIYDFAIWIKLTRTHMIFFRTINPYSAGIQPLNNVIATSIRRCFDVMCLLG